MNEKAIEELVESSKEISRVGYFRPDITYELLYEMYVVKGMSTSEIAEELGCSRRTVLDKLKEFGIKIRNRIRPDITYELLYEMYVVKRMSTYEIARELGCNYATIWYKLKKFGIKTRSVSEAMRDESVWGAEWDQFQKEVLDGLVLGDGGIFIGYRHAVAHYTQHCKHKEFLNHIINVLPDIFNKENNPYVDRSGWAISSRVNKYLTEQRYRYYPKGVKLIPEDIEITPTVLLYWYLGDGSLNNGKYISIACTSLYNGLDILISQLKELGILVNKQKGGIYIPKECNDRFFEVIGEKPPVKCYLYKWPSKYLTSEEMVLGYKYKRGLL